MVDTHNDAVRLATHTRDPEAFFALMRAADWHVLGARVGVLTAAAAAELWATGQSKTSRAVQAVTMCADPTFLRAVAAKDHRGPVRIALRANLAMPLRAWVALLDDLDTRETHVVAARVHVEDYDDVCTAVEQTKISEAAGYRISSALATHPQLTLERALGLAAERPNLMTAIMGRGECKLGNHDREHLILVLLAKCELSTAPSLVRLLATPTLLHILGQMEASVARAALAFMVSLELAGRPELTLDDADRLAHVGAAESVLNRLADNVMLPLVWRGGLPASIGALGEALAAGEATPDGWVLAAEMLEAWVGSTAELVETVTALTS